MKARFVNTIQSSLTRKLVLSYLLVVLIPVLVSCLYIFKTTQENVRKEFFGIVGSQLDQLDREITERIETCRQSAALIVRERNLINLLQNEEISDYLLVDTLMNDFIPKIMALRAQSRYIHSMRVIHGNRRIPNVFDSIYQDPEFNNGAWSKAPQALKTPGTLKYNNTYLELPHNETKYMDVVLRRENTVFTLYAPVYTIFMNQIIGIVETNILEKDIFVPLAQMSFKGYENIQVITSEGKVIYSKLEGVAPLSAELVTRDSDTFQLTMNGRSTHIVKKYVKTLGCWLVVYIPSSALEAGNNYRVIIIAVFLAGLLTLGLLAYLLSKVLLGKLVRLSNAMDVIKEGNLKTRVDIASPDEIGRLAVSFNGMIDRIDLLMDNVEQANRAEKEAIYKALENQINPHFLCNALEMVRMTAELHDDPEVASATMLIASYFMYNIKKKDRYVSLRDELKNVTEYLAIFNLIKNNRIEYGIQICDELSGRLEEFQVLKFILQPVVENAVKHGFADRNENCRIVIRIGMENEIITIHLEDNGDGISEGRMQELVRHMDPATPEIDFRTSGSGIGLRNINERLILQYGREYGLVLESVPGFGTVVTVRIPAMAGRGR